MDAAGAAKNFGAWPQKQVVSIDEQDLRAGVFQGLRQLRFHRRLSADRHEERGAHFIVERMKRRGPRARARSQSVEVKV
jgi:hypothetical protein